MALFTIQLAVHAGIVDQLLSFIVVATDAYRFYGLYFFKVNFKRVVGVVAGNAVVNCIVLFFAGIMAHGTLRYNFRPFWRVFDVTIKTGYSAVVFAASGGHNVNDLVMTFEAVFVSQRQRRCKGNTGK